MVLTRNQPAHPPTMIVDRSKSSRWRYSSSRWAEITGKAAELPPRRGKALTACVCS